MDNMLISIRDAAQMLGIGRSKLYDLMGAGQLTTVQIGRRRLVRADSVRALAFGRPANGHGPSSVAE